MSRKLSIILAAGLLTASFACSAWGAATAEELARLGKDLTPIGAEMAGNAAGTIPAWTGGITTPPAGYVKGKAYIDPYADDKILVTIDASNMDKYADQLTDGYKALMKVYPTFKMNVYPTHRSNSMPQRIYDATKRIAADAEIVEGGNGVINAGEGFPFPIPETGLEVVWNHLLRWRVDSVDRTYVAAPVMASGDYVGVHMRQRIDFNYSHAGMDDAKLNNKVLLYLENVTAPARNAGRILLVHDTLNQEKEHRGAWTYNPGQRRVRRAPHVAFDNPGIALDGLFTSDQTDMYNGSPQRYNWKLIGKQEMYVPYNAYKLQSKSLKISDIVRPKHMAPENLRYELHRVWKVEGTLKEGTRHIYKKRVFYIDEDSWSLITADYYDKRDQLWRVHESHSMNYYDVQTTWAVSDASYDLENGRYGIQYLSNEYPELKFNEDNNFKSSIFTVNSLRRSGRR